MSFNWINAEQFPIECLLLMDRWILRQLVGLGDSQKYDHDPEYRRLLGIILAYHDAIRWYFMNRCPESADRVASLVKDAPRALAGADLQECETRFLGMIDGFVVYVYPEVMNANCPYIRDWDADRLLSMADFTGKVVLDIGSGTGRLAFAAATKARKVYASEPADVLREFMRDKIAREGIGNVAVLDGTVEEIPFEDNTFDIVMSGYVVGLDYEKEFANMARVAKDGGSILLCKGEDDAKSDGPIPEILKAGFSWSHYVSKNGGDVYRYWRKVLKT